MQTLTVSYTFPLPGSYPRLPSFSLGFSQINRFAPAIKAQISIRSPPLGFDYRNEMTEDSRKVVAASHPELMDLVDEGSLILVEKRRFGPVPEWRSEFVEPEAIWLVGSSHVSQKSVVDVERVIRVLRPDNVVVELCRSRVQVLLSTESGLRLGTDYRLFRHSSGGLPPFSSSTSLR